MIKFAWLLHPSTHKSPLIIAIHRTAHQQNQSHSSNHPTPTHLNPPPPTAETLHGRASIIINYYYCAELGWRCVPLAVETYCNWGEEARGTFALLATRLAFGSSSFRKARVISDMFGRLNITLVRAIARAILARTVIPSDFS